MVAVNAFPSARCKEEEKYVKCTNPLKCCRRIEETAAMHDETDFSSQLLLRLMQIIK